MVEILSLPPALPLSSSPSSLLYLTSSFYFFFSFPTHPPSAFLSLLLLLLLPLHLFLFLFFFLLYLLLLPLLTHHPTKVTTMARVAFVSKNYSSALLFLAFPLTMCS